MQRAVQVDAPVVAALTRVDDAALERREDGNDAIAAVCIQYVHFNRHDSKPVEAI